MIKESKKNSYFLIRSALCIDDKPFPLVRLFVYILLTEVLYCSSSWCFYSPGSKYYVFLRAREWLWVAFLVKSSHWPMGSVLGLTGILTAYGKTKKLVQLFCINISSSLPWYVQFSWRFSPPTDYTQFNFTCVYNIDITFWEPILSFHFYILYHFKLWSRLLFLSQCVYEHLSIF